MPERQGHEPWGGYAGTFEARGGYAGTFGDLGCLSLAQERSPSGGTLGGGVCRNFWRT